MRKIIIPAAGKAVRFNGVYKELAGIDSHTSATALDHTIWLAVHRLQATHIVLVTSKEKRETHIEYLETIIHKYSDIIFNVIIQNDDRDLLGAIVTGLTIQPMYMAGGLLLPDTITDFDEVTEEPKGITFGLFDTTEPERFSVVFNDTIYTKDVEFPEGTYQAWGVVLWDRDVAHKMIMTNHLFATYDQVFRHMMRDGYQTFSLDYYYDIGTVEKYIEYLAEIQ